MDGVSRFSVSIPHDLLGKFDMYLKEKRYQTRSEGIRDLMRNALIAEEWDDPAAEVMGTISIVYDHHTRELDEKLKEIQHAHYEGIISTTHVHVDHHNCFEVMLVRGRADAIRKIGNMLISARGVKVGRITLLSTGKNI